MASAPIQPGLTFKTLGYSGLPRFNGYVFDDFLPELQGPRGRRTIREMADNSAVIGAFLFGAMMLIRQVGWHVDPDPGLANDDDERASFIDDALNDMATTWPDRLSEILTFLPFGWSFHELVYKRRDGINSRFNDGKIGWYDWPLRGQETLLRWEFDDDGNVLGMTQLGAPTYREVTIPMEKALLFRTSVARGSPEGRSILRNAYTSYYFRKHIEVFQGIGIERDLAGIPYLRIPGSILAAQNNPKASPEELAALQAYQALATSVKVDENQGIILPSDVDPDTKTPLYTFELLHSSGSKQFNAMDIMHEYDVLMAQTVLADFIQLGHQAVGSKALAQSKTEMFTAGLRAWLFSVSSVINDVAIPRLLRLNGMSTDQPPKLHHGEIEREDLQALGQYVLNLAQSGFQLDTRFDSNLTKDLLEKGRMPDPPDDAPPLLNLPSVTVPQPADDATPDTDTPEPADTGVDA